MNPLEFLYAPNPCDDISSPPSRLDLLKENMFQTAYHGIQGLPHVLLPAFLAAPVPSVGWGYLMSDFQPDQEPP